MNDEIQEYENLLLKHLKAKNKDEFEKTLARIEGDIPFLKQWSAKGLTGLYQNYEQELEDLGVKARMLKILSELGLAP